MATLPIILQAAITKSAGLSRGNYVATWDFTTAIHGLFPTVNTRSAFVAGLDAAVLHCTTMEDAQEVLPLLKELVPLMFNDTHESGQIIDSAYSRVKNAFRDSTVVAYVLHLFRATKDQATHTKQVAIARREFRLAHRITRTYTQVCVQIATGLQGSFSQICFALEQACGARSIEILHVSTFEESHESPNYITQNGIAKCRDRGNFVRITKPLVGCTWAQFKEGLAKVRAVVDPGACAMTRAEIGAKYQVGVRKVAKALYGDAEQAWGYCGSHIARAIYAQSAFVKMENTVDRSSFITRVLGHSINLTNYNCVQITLEPILDPVAAAVTIEAMISGCMGRYLAKLPVRDSGTGAIMVDIGGHSFAKTIKKRNQTTKQKLERLNACIELLVEKQIPVSMANLIKFGISRQQIRVLKPVLDA